MKKILSLSLFLCIFYGLLKSQPVVTIIKKGTTTWVCPATVTSVQIECYGAGGAGGGTTTNSSHYVGGGGAGGNYVKNTSVTVVPGTSYTVSVGAGGVNTSATGAAGGATSFSGPGITTITAAGGCGGFPGNSAGAGAGGTYGATGTNSGYSGSYTYRGGNGASGNWISSSNSTSGGGGSSAGVGANGNSGTAPTGGTAPAGGYAGTDGLTSDGQPTNDVNGFGFGGAGARGSALKGSVGGDGYIKISYIPISQSYYSLDEIPTKWSKSLSSTFSISTLHLSEMEDIIASKKLTSSSDYQHAARVTQSVANAILARVCLKAAGYPLNLGVPMYQKALYYALEVRKSNIHKLHPDYQQLFINQSADAYDFLNRESIWEAEFVGNSVTNPDRGTKYSTIGSRIGIESAEEVNIGYGYGFVCARLKLHDLYNEDLNDKRKARAIADYKVASTGIKTTITDIAQRTAGKWRREEETLMPRHKNYTSTNVSIIRYADVLLMIAEAENELNGPTALAHEAINEVRQRAGVITYTEDNGNNFINKDAFRKAVQDERARELCFEGVRKMDLVRWGSYVNEMQLAANQATNDSRATSRRDMMIEVAGKMSVRDLLFPIPQSELKLNNKMTQNPLW